MADDTRDRGLWLAGALLGVAGLFDTVAGAGDLTADMYVSVADGAARQHDITGWAWSHLVIGIVTVLAGVFVPLNRCWSKVLALTAVVAFVVLHLFYLPYRPIQTVLVLGLALTAARLVLTHRFRPRKGHR